MGAFLIYLLKSGVCLAVFCLLVKALLSRETFFRFNRAVLLAGVGVCLLLPFVRVGMQEDYAVQLPFTMLERVVVGADTAPADDVPETGGTFDWLMLLSALYFIGFLVNLILVLRPFAAIRLIISRGEVIRQSDCRLVVTQEEITPFSWGRYIVMSRRDFEQEPEPIIIHEKAHVRARHSIDVVFMEAVSLLQWFNPAVWLLKRELRDVHEFQADMAVLQSGIDATQYQLLLVRKAVGQSSYSLANSFNHSKLKKRITMMLKKRSSNWAWLKLLALLPVGLLAVCAFGSSAEPDLKSEQPETSSNAALLDVDQMPVFSGGNKAFTEFLKSELQYPAELKEKGAQGTVMVRFTVEKDGKVSSAEVISSPDSLFSEEALRVVSKMPDWTPAMKDGEPVSFDFAMPIQFALSRSPQESQ